MNALRSVSSVCGLLLLGSTFAQRVNNAEYFWNNDPGPGNAIPFQAVDGAYDQALEALLVNTNALPVLATRVLGIRVQDRNNLWGPTFRTVVQISGPVSTIPDIRISSGEYFWDTDPGIGNGTPLLAMDGNFNDALEAIALETGSLPSPGVHVLNVRMLDVQGGWSLPFSVVVDVLPGSVSFPQIRVQQAECYVNDDPGAGNGTPMWALDGSFDAAWEALRAGSIPAPVSSGVNVLWVRAKDVDDAWGPEFGVVVNIDTTITGTVGVQVTAEPAAMVISPNPSTSGQGFDIQLNRPLAGMITVRALDTQGRKVMDIQLPAGRRVHIDWPYHVSTGAYLIEVGNGGTWLRQRLVLDAGSRR
jgi:hypothetical protein